MGFFERSLGIARKSVHRNNLSHVVQLGKDDLDRESGLNYASEIGKIVSGYVEWTDCVV